MKTTLLILTTILYGLSVRAGVVTYPAPAGERLSEDYQVRAGGQKVDVYTARTLDPPFAGKEWDFGGPYSFANFDLAGTGRFASLQKSGCATPWFAPLGRR